MFVRKYEYEYCMSIWDRRRLIFSVNPWDAKLCQDSRLMARSEGREERRCEMAWEIDRYQVVCSELMYGLKSFY